MARGPIGWPGRVPGLARAGRAAIARAGRAGRLARAGPGGDSARPLGPGWCGVLVLFSLNHGHQILLSTFSLNHDFEAYSREC